MPAQSIPKPPFTRADFDRIFEEVKANSERLRGCSGPHDFVELQEAANRPPRYRCAKCKGEVDAINRRWYLEGVVHGRLEAAR